jgi:hypothetical protein
VKPIAPGSFSIALDVPLLSSSIELGKFGNLVREPSATVFPRSETNMFVDIPGVRAMDSPDTKGTCKMTPAIFLLMAAAQMALPPDMLEPQ